MMALPHNFYAHVADSLARLRCAPPSVLCAPPTGPCGPFGGLVSLRQTQGFGSPAALRSVQCLGPAFQPIRMTIWKGCPISIWPTLAFFHCASMIIVAACIRRTVRKVPAYAG